MHFFWEKYGMATLFVLYTHTYYIIYAFLNVCHSLTTHQSLIYTYVCMYAFDDYKYEVDFFPSEVPR